MIKSNLFIFDTTKGFARFIKSYFSDKYTISSCTIRKNLKNYDLEEFNIAVVLIDKVEEVDDFLQIKLKINHVFAASNLREVRLLLNAMQDVKVLDLDKIKRLTIEELINNFKCIELNP